MQHGDATPTTGPEAGPEIRPKKKNLDLRALLTAAGIVSQLTSFRARLSGTRHSITKLCGDKAIDLSSAWTKPSMPARRSTIAHAATTTDICVYMRIASMPCPGPAPPKLDQGAEQGPFPTTKHFRSLDLWSQTLGREIFAATSPSILLLPSQPRSPTMSRHRLTRSRVGFIWADYLSHQGAVNWPPPGFVARSRR